MANWKKSQNYKLKQKIENNKKKQVEDVANGKEPREFKMPKTRRSTAADAFDSYMARRAAREQVYGSETPTVTGSTRTSGDIMSEAVDRLRDRISMNKNGVGTSPVESRIPTVVPTTNPRNMVTAESKLKKPNYVGNVDINHRPVVWNEDGSKSTTSTAFNQKWVGDEENGHYNIGHFATITNDGRRLEGKELDDYIDLVLGSDDPFETDRQNLNLLYKIDDKLANGEYIRDENLPTAFQEAEDWDNNMHVAQDNMYRKRQNKFAAKNSAPSNRLTTDPMTISSDLVNTVAAKGKWDQREDIERNKALARYNANLVKENNQREAIQTAARDERERLGINPNEISAAALDQIKSMRNGDGTSLTSRVDAEPVVQDTARNTREYQWARKHPLEATAISAFINPVTGVEGLVNTGRQALTKDKIDANELRGTILQDALRQGITRGTKDRLNEPLSRFGLNTSDDGRETGAEQLTDFGVGLGLDALNATTGRLALGPANLAAMSGNAASQSLYKGVRDDEKTRDQVLATSIANGAFEYLFEKLSYDNFVKNNLDPTSFKNVLKNFLVSFGIGGSEEFHTEIADTVADAVINREKSDAGRLYDSLLLHGASIDDAVREVIKDTLLNAGISFIGGGLSEGLSAAGGGMYNTFRNAQNLQEIAPTRERERQMYNDIAAEADENSELGRMARDYVKKLNDGGNTNVIEKGFFANAMDRAAEGATYDENYNDDEKVFEPEDTVTDISGAETQVSTQEQIKETVATAVNAIKEEQSSDVVDTSESTPEEAKNLTQQAVEAVRAEETVQAEAESEKITTENTTESDSQENVPSENKSVVNAVDLGREDINDNKIAEDAVKPTEYKESVSETTENKKSVNVPRENTKADKKASAALRTNLNVPEGVREKSDRRFPSDADAKSVYESGFEKFYDYFDADVVSNSLDIVERAYDENMAKAYDLGLQGKSLLSAAKDEAFNNFNTKFGDLTEQMWQAGYNRRAESNRAKSEKVASERVKTGEASVTETDRNSKINDELRLMARGKNSENKTVKKTDLKGNFSDDNRRQKFEESLHKEDFETTKNEGSNAEARPLDDILGDYSHRFGFNYTSGSRYVKGNKEGQYNLRDKGIRTKVTNALPAFSHEFGHWLADKYNIESTNKDLPKEVRLEAEKAFNKNLSEDNYKSEDVTDEGIAEFIRYYCTNKDTARIDYPAMSDYILSNLSPKDLADFQAMADSINAVLAAGSEDMTQHTALHEDRNPDFRTKGEILKDKWNHAYQLWVDSNHSLRLLDRKYGSDTHTYATNAEYADSRIEYALTDSLYDFDGRYLGPGLKPILSPINVNDKKEYEALGDYLVLSHAPERLALGKRTFADDRQNNELWMRKQADKILEKYPHFKGVAEQLYRFQDKVLLYYGVEQGLISRDAYKAMKKDYKRYVPFFRAGFTTNGDALKTAKGSGRTIINPVDNIITSTTKMMRAGMRNAIMLNMRSAAINNNYDAMFMEHIPDPKVPVTYDVKKMKDDLLDNAAYALNGYEAAPEAIDILQDVFDQVDDTLVQFKTGRANKSRNEISIMVDGKPEFWKINDPLLMDTISSMDYRGSNALLDAYGKVTRFMTNNLTGGNVKWSIFSNAPRDFQTYMYFTDNKNPASAVGNIFDSWKNSWNDAWGQPVDDYYREFMGMGAGGAPVWSGDENYVKEIRKNLSNKKNFNPLAPLRFLSDTIELGPRYATYKFCRERGMTPQQAFYASMEVTTNFRRHGIYSKEANKVFQFFNANLQGIDHALRYYMAEDLKGEFKNLSKEEAAKRRGKAIMGRVSFMVAASLIGSTLNYLINHRSKDDKDEYNKLSNYLKNTNFTFSLGDGKFFSIPKGHELLVLESFFERALEYYFDKNDDALKGYYDYLTDNIAPPIVSDMMKFPANAVTNGMTPAVNDLVTGALSGAGIFGVIAQEYANKNFRGKDIVYKNPYSKAPAKSEYNARTSEMAYLIGQALNVSPQHIDHFCENVLGWIWETQEALNPIDDKKGTKGKRDYSIGVYNTYFRDNLYSNDISNWIYDKADKSEERYNDTGDNLLEMALDKNMKSYYANFSKASRMDINTAEGRAAKSGVLDELIAYKKGKTSPEEKKVYDLVEKTGDESYLPDALSNNFKNNGENVSLNGREYVQYQKTFNDNYYALIDESLDSKDDIDKQKYAASQAEKIAKQLAMDEILKAKGIEPGKSSEKTENMKQYMNLEGADFDMLIDTMYDVERIQHDMPGKDKQYARQKAVANKIKSSTRDKTAQEKLWEIAGYSVSTFKKF